MKSNKGFTLIELLVVIAIIGVLASVVLVSLQGARSKGKDTRVISDVQQLRALAESTFNGTNYSVVFSAANSNKTGRTTGSAGQGITSNTTALQLADDARSNEGDIFVLTNAGPTVYSIYGVLPSVAAHTNYFCIASDGTTKQNTTAFSGVGTCN